MAIDSSRGTFDFTFWLHPAQAVSAPSASTARTKSSMILCTSCCTAQVMADGHGCDESGIALGSMPCRCAATGAQRQAGLAEKLPAEQPHQRTLPGSDLVQGCSEPFQAQQTKSLVSERSSQGQCCEHEFELYSNPRSVTLPASCDRKTHWLVTHDCAQRFVRLAELLLLPI